VSEARPQRLAVEQLRDNVGRAVVEADVVDGEDVGMVEASSGACFLLEAAEALGIAQPRFGTTLRRAIAERKESRLRRIGEESCRGDTATSRTRTPRNIDSDISDVR